jgi:hypothetical protein
MPTIEKVKETIATIAQRRKNVALSEIEWVLNQLRDHGWDVRERKTRHGVLYGVGSERFSVCTHHPGSREVKPCYVDNFAEAMANLGLYED